MPGGYVAGHKFGDENEYNAALEDIRIINRLKSQTDMKNPVSVKKLYATLQSGEIRFKTIVGRDFDDEIFDLITELESEETRAENAGKKKHGLILHKKKEKKAQDKALNAASDHFGGMRIESRSEKIERATSAVRARSSGMSVSELNISKPDSKGEDRSDDIDIAAKEIVRRDELKRRIIISVAVVVAVISMGYFAVYSRSAYASQAEYDELASLKGTDPVAEQIEQKPLFTLAEAAEIPEILDEYKNIYIKNKSVIGWLTIDGTNIDYPVMQTVNNEYYLTHDFNGKDDNNGSLFLDCNCNAMFRSTNLIVYGHHMKSGKMFGNLKKYKNEDYCKEHSIIKFDTIYEKGVYEVMYVFTDTIKDAEDVSFKYYQFIDAVSEEEFDSNMKAMAEMSFFDTGVTAEYGDDLLTLSTCDSSASTARFVVVARRIPNDQIEYVYK